MNYEEIKKLAKQNKCSIKDLIALAPSNDPFYCGSEDTMKKAEWFANVLNEFNITPPFHIRRIHYAILNATKPDALEALHPRRIKKDSRSIHIKICRHKGIQQSYKRE